MASTKIGSGGSDLPFVRPVPESVAGSPFTSGAVAVSTPELTGLHLVSVTGNPVHVRFSNRKSLEAIGADVVAGGSGYAVNDILTVVGGISSVAAQFKVAAVSSGAITSVTLWTLGNYSRVPGNPVSVSGGGDGLATLSVRWRIVVANAHSQALSAVVAAGGTGYTVGDILTVVGGTGTAAQFRVLTAPGGVVGTVTPHVRGDYTATPSNPAATTGGTGGDDCTLTVTYGAIQVVSAATATSSDMLLPVGFFRPFPCDGHVLSILQETGAGKVYVEKCAEDVPS